MKNFRITIFAWSLLILALALLLAFLVMKTGFYVVTFLLAVSIVLATVLFIRYVDKTNRDISALFASIRHDDFSTAFTPSKKGRSFQQLYDELNEIGNQFVKIRAEKASQYQYLQTVVESVDVGLICYRKDGKISLINQALKQLLHKPYLNSLESLNKSWPELYQTLKSLQHNDKSLIRLQIDNETVQLALQATEFKLQEESYTLVSVKNIRGELEANELEAWQKLIRILTHEIMNSVTPLMSLTGTIREMLADDEVLQEADVLEDAREGLMSIENRSRGLLTFTQSYRDLMQVPPPNFQEIELGSFLRSIQTLFSAEFSEKGIISELLIPEHPVRFSADPGLLEQVLVNLLTNAMDALEDVSNPMIIIRGNKLQNQKVSIEIEDNAEGISKDLQEKIFIPFYSGKEGGSGIGLSLCRQIMQMHKGRISLQSSEGSGSCFTLVV